MLAPLHHKYYPNVAGIDLTSRLNSFSYSSSHLKTTRNNTN